jgi:hypothetical protein
VNYLGGIVLALDVHLLRFMTMLLFVTYLPSGSCARSSLSNSSTVFRNSPRAAIRQTTANILLVEGHQVHMRHAGFMSAGTV